MHPIRRPSRRASRPLAAFACAALVGALAAAPVAADHGTHVTLEPNTTGCNGVLPSRDGNTDMRLVGGTLQPGGTAIFEITYPVNSDSVGKEFTITDCAFIDGVAALKYTVTFVPSNQNYVLLMALGVPADAPVGGLYCNYAKTTGSPTAAQSSQRKAGPACFNILGPTQAPAPAPGAPAPNPPASGGSAGGATPAPGTPAARTPLRLPDTATVGGGPADHDAPIGALAALALAVAGLRLMRRARLGAAERAVR